MELAKIVPLPAPFARAVQVIIILIGGVIILFYGLIPLLRMLPGSLPN